MAKLLILENSGSREFELVDDEVGIGRELDNALRLSDPSISRHHAVLRRTASGYEIQDLGSSNGVLVNGARVQASPLNHGDRITLGQLHMTFQNPPASEAAPAPAPAEVSSPLGTVRIDAAEMAKLHTGTPGQTKPVAAIPSAAPSAEDDRATLKASAGEPEAVVSKPAPSDQPNPAPAFLQAWLPPVPDDAQPIMMGGAAERGDFLTRFLAHIIDMVPLIALFTLCYVISFVLGQFPGLACLVGAILSALQGILVLAYSFLFLPWCWAKFGATPGKKIMKLRVVPEDDPNGRIDFGTALLRVIGHILNIVVGYLLIFGAERKAVQDMLSKSIVIKVDR